MRNNLLIGLVLAAASSSVFAMPTETFKHPAILEVALTGGGYVAGAEGTDYGIQLASFSSLGKPTGSVLSANPSYKFGGEILLGYFFCGSTINVDASYFGTHHSINDSASGDLATILPPDYPEGAATARSNYNFRYDFANVEVGSLTRVNCNGLIINPQLGLSYARLKGDQSVSYLSSLDTSDGQFQQQSSFNGFGPSVGFDLNFVVCNPITLVGNFRFNGLIGDVKSSYSATNDTGTDTLAINSHGHRSLVSLFQSELAIAYDFDWISAFCGNLALGYQVTKAVGSGKNMTFVDDVADARFSSSTLDSSIHGWFLRLTMDFAV